ncbi:MAG: hypothetical protein P3W89_004990 [Aquificaceae bacterium]|nr:hypothetical protein [Aquificaceae bacterium]
MTAYGGPFLFIPLCLFFPLRIPIALKKKIKENWNRLSHPQKVYQLYKLINFECLWLCNSEKTDNFYTLQEIFTEVIHHGIKPRENTQP